MNTQVEVDYDEEDIVNRPFLCSFDGCGKRFSKSSNLTQHLRIHTGEMPYECKVCNRKFRQSGNLTKHLKSHQNAHLRWNRSTNEKPFRCTFDGCDKSFTAKSSLQNHIRTHTGEVPYRCDFPACDERFHAKSALFNHVKYFHKKRVLPLYSSTTSSVSVADQKPVAIAPIIPASLNSIRNDCLHSLADFVSKTTLDDNFLHGMKNDFTVSGSDELSSDAFDLLIQGLQDEVSSPHLSNLSSSHDTIVDVKIEDVCGFMNDTSDPEGTLGFAAPFPEDPLNFAQECSPQVPKKRRRV